jgi:hypothetical protein
MAESESHGKVAEVRPLSSEPFERAPQAHFDEVPMNRGAVKLPKGSTEVKHGRPDLGGKPAQADRVEISLREDLLGGLRQVSSASLRHRLNSGDAGVGDTGGEAQDLNRRLFNQDGIDPWLASNGVEEGPLPEVQPGWNLGDLESEQLVVSVRGGRVVRANRVTNKSWGDAEPLTPISFRSEQSAQVVLILIVKTDDR